MARRAIASLNTITAASILAIIQTFILVVDVAVIALADVDAAVRIWGDEPAQVPGARRHRTRVAHVIWAVGPWAAAIRIDQLLTLVRDVTRGRCARVAIIGAV